MSQVDTCLVGMVSHHQIIDISERVEFLLKLEELMREYEVVSLDIAIDPYKFAKEFNVQSSSESTQEQEG